MTQKLIYEHKKKCIQPVLDPKLLVETVHLFEPIWDPINFQVASL